MTQYRFLEPLDVLHLRGNRLFGEGSDGGSALMPPWPSAFAGALRSWLLAGAGIDPVAYGRGEVVPDGPLGDALGTPSAPGGFTLASVNVACLGNDGRVSPTWLLPADVSVFEAEADKGKVQPHRLRPMPVPRGVRTSLALPQLPALTRNEAAKPVSGYRLNAEGWQRYLHGDPLTTADLVKQETLWRTDRRLGIALDANRSATERGQLYTSEAISLSRQPRTGFLVGMDGIDLAALPAGGTLRLGGDGRGAAVHVPAAEPVLAGDPSAPVADGRFRLVLTTPGIFSGGWRLPGLDAEGQWHIPGATARLVSAAVPRHGVVSGWDLARHRPKPAQRAAPAGSVYWFEGLEGDPQALGKLSASGLWALGADNDHPARRAEGFNRFAIAAY